MLFVYNYSKSDGLLLSSKYTLNFLRRLFLLCFVSVIFLEQCSKLAERQGNNTTCASNFVTLTPPFETKTMYKSNRDRMRSTGLCFFFRSLLSVVCFFDNLINMDQTHNFDAHVVVLPCLTASFEHSYIKKTTPNMKWIIVLKNKSNSISHFDKELHERKRKIDYAWTITCLKSAFAVTI